MVIDPKACLGVPRFDALAVDLDAERLGAWCRVFAWMT
jgi:hypothetical protein